MLSDDFKSIYPKYFEENKEYVYGSVENWLIVYKKVNIINFSITKTNENRDNIYDKQYATYFASKLKVILIVDKFNPEISINTLNFNKFNETIKLKINKVAKSKKNKLVFYYLVEIAYYQDILSTQFSYTGLHKSWYDNGRKSSEGSYLENEKNGKWQYWYNLLNNYDPETKSSEVVYLDGNIVKSTIFVLIKK